MLHFQQDLENEGIPVQSLNGLLRGGTSFCAILLNAVSHLLSFTLLKGDV